jgi:hypothetical protein
MESCYAEEVGDLLFRCLSPCLTFKNLTFKKATNYASLTWTVTGRRKSSCLMTEVQPSFNFGMASCGFGRVRQTKFGACYLRSEGDEVL